MTTQEINDKFKTLLCELSPENLHCDGEISVTAAKKKEKKLMKRWKDLEKIVGHKVSEEDAYDRII